MIKGFQFTNDLNLNGSSYGLIAFDYGIYVFFLVFKKKELKFLYIFPGEKDSKFQQHNRFSLSNFQQSLIKCGCGILKNCLKMK